MDHPADALPAHPIPYVYAEAVRRHDPQHEVWVGRSTPATEVPLRADLIRAGLREAGHPEVAALAYPDDVLLQVHEPGMVEWLRTAHRAWTDGPYAELVGQDRVVPYLFPTPMMTSGMPWRYPAATHARAGVWCYDTMTLVGPGTWEAARAAVDAALTAVDLVVDAEGGPGPAPAAYALTRPPGHHAAPAGFGGSCYLNSAAVAAQALSARGRRVAVVDVDAHHGNGTQAVFWRRPDVLFVSLHVDPGAGWFPHVVGFGDETGAGDGSGTTLNLPLPPGTGDDGWLDGVRAACSAVLRFDADALVVSLGVDAHEDDPESPLRVSRDGYARTGALLAALGLPTVLVQEGGYRPDTLAGLVAATLAPFGAGR